MLLRWSCKVSSSSLLLFATGIKINCLIGLRHAMPNNVIFFNATLSIPALPVQLLNAQIMVTTVKMN